MNLDPANMKRERPGRRRGRVRVVDFKPGAYLQVNEKLWEVVTVDEKGKRVQLQNALDYQLAWMRFSTILGGPWTLVQVGRDVEAEAAKVDTGDIQEVSAA